VLPPGSKARQVCHAPFPLQESHRGASVTADKQDNKKPTTIRISNEPGWRLSAYAKIYAYFFTPIKALK
jgi:hypothetical protein